MSAAVKICGIRDAGTLAAVAELPVEYAGFVFAQSRRKVNADEAAAMMEPWLAKADGRRPSFVGVFVNPAMDELEQILRRAPLDVVQLHGEETPEFCREVRERFGVKVWKVFSVTNAVSDSNADADRDSETSHADAAGAPLPADTSAKRLSHEKTVNDRLLPYCGAIDGIMLDHGKGGTGTTFSWDLLPPYREFASSHGLPLIVAGGLDAGNVGILLDAHRPDVVDVSSGVETDGIKDKDKIRAFVGKVKSVGHVS